MTVPCFLAVQPWCRVPACTGSLIWLLGMLLTRLRARVGGGAPGSNNHSSIFQSPFASHPRSNAAPGAAASSGKAGAGGAAMPALPSPQAAKAADAAGGPMPQVSPAPTADHMHLLPC